MADVTYYVALPFLQDDAGSPVAGAAEECQSSSAALRRAELLSRGEGCIGALAGIAKKCNGRPDVQYHIVSNRLLVGSKHYGSPGDTQFTQRQPRSAERGADQGDRARAHVV